MINLLIIPAMAILNRWRGHASKYKRYFPRPWSQLALSLPFGYIAANNSIISAFIPYQEYVTPAVITLTTLLFWLSGWGNGHDLGTRPRGKPETLEWPVLWLHGRIPEYWYDFIFLAWRGACITIPTGLVIGNIAFAISGASMALAYAIGHAVWDYAVEHGKTERRVIEGTTDTYLAIRFLPRHLDEATAIGEFLLGAFIGLSIYLVTL